MPSISHSLTRRAKQFAEHRLGVSISRVRRAPPNKHADEAIRRIRRWSSADVVFDVGANDGRTVLRIQEQLSSPRVYAFEPVSRTYRVLVERTSHLPNVRAFPFALGAACGRDVIHLNEIAAMNSLSPGWTAAPTGVETVDVTTVDRVMEEQRIDFIHFLKIDTEGYELEVLKGAEAALRASRVAIVQLEVGVDQIEKRFLTLEAARRHLAARGYALYGVYNQCRRQARPPRAWSAEQAQGYNAEVLAYCDALFIGADL